MWLGLWVSVELQVWPGTLHVFPPSRWPLGRPGSGHRVSSCPPAQPPQKVDSTAPPARPAMPPSRPTAPCQRMKKSQEWYWKPARAIYVTKQVIYTGIMTLRQTDLNNTKASYIFLKPLFSFSPTLLYFGCWCCSTFFPLISRSFTVTSHMKKNVTVTVLVLLCSVRCQEGVETHRWSGWFPLSEIWVRARAQISGPHSWSNHPQVCGRTWIWPRGFV